MRVKEKNSSAIPVFLLFSVSKTLIGTIQEITDHTKTAKKPGIAISSGPLSCRLFVFLKHPEEAAFLRIRLRRESNVGKGFLKFPIKIIFNENRMEARQKFFEKLWRNSQDWSIQQRQLLFESECLVLSESAA